MKVKFDVVCPEGDDKFSYYPMKLDYRLIKNITLPHGWAGGCMVELISGQVIHAEECFAVVQGRLDYCRAAGTCVSKARSHDL